ncbi:hypothetical protein [Alteromonas lipotrueiana]|uniref:hypothetical protein n=1 Tax=Alteromonas lipotrueiana TaxID=2803815 RepID=UPI001C440858|nr:hypothetical protein [Alteromonas lipotrueiana]
MVVYSALVCAGLGVGSLYAGWRQSKRWLGGLALLLWAGSMVLFYYGTGWQYAMVYSLLLPALLVWIGIIYQATTKPLQHYITKPRPLNTSLSNIGKHVVVAGVVLGAELVFSLTICLTVARWLPITYSGQLALCIVTQPVVWAFMAYHFLASKQPVRTLAFHFIVALIFGALLLL